MHLGGHTLYQQPVHSLADVSSNGMLSRSAANTITPRSIAAGSTITVTNGDGSAGNPTIAFSVAPGTSGNILTSNGTAWTSAINTAATKEDALFLATMMG